MAYGRAEPLVVTFCEHPLRPQFHVYGYQVLGAGPQLASMLQKALPVAECFATTGINEPYLDSLET
jgi:hypothetical protein